ncbi:HD-GYP domain-containing protein [Butyrivibrio sp. MC2013]|uniref:HD-GYP domain-containing protein n=1 Tax=Butyrivibrio sp. MC2013 TaxID=1280686 RepID=UPI00041DA74E|nr:HD-GYP domain-containing protein [Butyrivibrio sp. MC2013]
MKTARLITIRISFVIVLLIAVLLFIVSFIKADNYNKTEHKGTYSSQSLFTDIIAGSVPVAVRAAARGSTWTKCFDLYDEGLTDPNYQAYTYDFNVCNNTADEISDYSFKLAFNTEVFLLSAWNGSLEIHQFIDEKEYVNTVPDLRDYDASDYTLDTVQIDGDVLVRMNPGDYLVYYPSSTINAMEIPVEPHKVTVPGLILYVKIGDSIFGSVLDLTYHFKRNIIGEPLFWISIGAGLIWLLALINYAVSSSQIHKYNERHMRDNEIIQEAIETFIGFIDAKDPYTHGHSGRVAEYTRMIASKMGYKGEELDKIYYVALLHDCGKIGIPDNILRKPGKLTPEEYEIIKSHTIKGGEILSSFKSLSGVGEGALYHHERYDGRGYPKGLSGEDIPLIARMICVADSFDAMNSNRVYRKKLTRDTIINEIVTNKGKQFDPVIANIFLGLIGDGSITMD